MTTRTTVVLAAILAAAAPAAATIQVFFTGSAQGYGLTNPSLAFTPTLGPDLDPVLPGIQAADGAAYTVASFPPLSSGPGNTPAINYAAGEFAYIWVRFVDAPPNQRILGLRLTQASAQEVAFYVQNDLAGDSGSKRWDGDYTLPGAPEFKQKINQVLVGLVGLGLKNASNTSYDWNLYDRTTRTYLLGAVRYDQPGVFSIDIPNNYNGIFVGGTVYVSRQIGSAFWGPEPATIAMLAAIAVLPRRRTM